MKNLKNINDYLISFTLTLAILYFGASFLIPFVFGIFMAILMFPFCNLLESIKINRIIAALISTLVVFIVVGGILFLFTFQVEKFISKISFVRDEINTFIENLENKITPLTNLTAEEQKEFWLSRTDQIISRIEGTVTNFLSRVLNTLTGFLFSLIYLFLLLLYRNRIKDFIMMYTSDEKREKIKGILNESTKVVFHYLWGRTQVMSILGIAYYITFLIFGLPYAILLSIFGALITIIPYFGPFISGLLPILFSFIFFDSLPKSLVFSVIIIIEQLIESYVLEPLIIGQEVKLNPLIVIVAVIIGGMIWGIAGMVLFVPLVAMFKIISNNTPGLEPIGFLFGNSKKHEDK
jgi:predicted PurR-regulated permease PerM